MRQSTPARFSGAPEKTRRSFVPPLLKVPIESLLLPPSVRRSPLLLSPLTSRYSKVSESCVINARQSAPQPARTNHGPSQPTGLPTTDEGRHTQAGTHDRPSNECVTAVIFSPGKKSGGKSTSHVAFHMWAPPPPLSTYISPPNLPPILLPVWSKPPPSSPL